MLCRLCPDALEAVLPNHSGQSPDPLFGSGDGLCAHSLRFCQRGLEPLFRSLHTFGCNSGSRSDRRTSVRQSKMEACEGINHYQPGSETEISNWPPIIQSPLACLPCFAGHRMSSGRE